MVYSIWFMVHGIYDTKYIGMHIVILGPFGSAGR